MAQYLLRRILLMIPTLLGITFVTFLIIRLAPGDPVAFRLGTGAEMGTSEGGAGDASLDREKQILKAKVRASPAEIVPRNNSRSVKWLDVNHFPAPGFSPRGCQESSTPRLSMSTSSAAETSTCPDRYSPVL